MTMGNVPPPVGVVVQDFGKEAKIGENRQARRRASFMDRYNASIAAKEALSSQERSAISGAPQATDPAGVYTAPPASPVVYQDVAPQRPVLPQLEADAHIVRLTQAIQDVKASGLNEKDVRVVASRVAAHDIVGAYELLRGAERIAEARDRQGKQYVKEQKALQAQKAGEWLRDFRLRHPQFNHIHDGDIGPLMDSAGLGQPVQMQRMLSNNMLHRVAAMDDAAVQLSVYLERIGARTIPQRNADPAAPVIITEGATPHSAYPSRTHTASAPASLGDALKQMKLARRAQRAAASKGPHR